MLFSQCYILSLFSVFCLTSFVIVQGENCSRCCMEDLMIQTFHLVPIYLKSGRALLSCRPAVLGKVKVEVESGQYELLSKNWSFTVTASRQSV